MLTMGSSLIAQRGDSFQRHVARALHCPLVILFHEQSADQPGDRSFVRNDANDVTASLDLAVEAFEWIGAMQLGPMLSWKAHVGHYIHLGIVHEGGSLGTRGRTWSATSRHCLRAATASSWAKAVPIQAETMRRWVFPAWASAFLLK